MPIESNSSLRFTLDVPAKPKNQPNVFVIKSADDYKSRYGFTNYYGAPPFESLTTDLGKSIADLYDAALHQPFHRPVTLAYEELRVEILQQFRHAVESGFRVEPWEKDGQPYSNSFEMTEDIRQSKHLYFFTGGDIPSDHPLAGRVNGLTYNDVFRAIHDLYAHAQNGYEFGPKGEFNAYLDDCKMFSPFAIRALTTETLGQNCWVNYGKHLRRPDGGLPEKGDTDYISLALRPYAQQKATILEAIC